jgi:hypothetical protein
VSEAALQSCNLDLVKYVYDWKPFEISLGMISKCTNHVQVVAWMFEKGVQLTAEQIGSLKTDSLPTAVFLVKKCGELICTYLCSRRKNSILTPIFAVIPSALSANCHLMFFKYAIDHGGKSRGSEKDQI